MKWAHSSLICWQNPWTCVNYSAWHRQEETKKWTKWGVWMWTSAMVVGVRTRGAATCCLSQWLHHAWMHIFKTSLCTWMASIPPLCLRLCRSSKEGEWRCQANWPSQPCNYTLMRRNFDEFVEAFWLEKSEALLPSHEAKDVWDEIKWAMIREKKSGEKTWWWLQVDNWDHKLMVCSYYLVHSFVITSFDGINSGVISLRLQCCILSSHSPTMPAPSKKWWNIYCWVCISLTEHA